MANDHIAVAQPFCGRIMIMWITCTVIMLAVLMALLVSAKVSGKGVLSHGLCDDLAIVNFENGKVRATPEVIRNDLTLFGGNGNLHNFFLSWLIPFSKARTDLQTSATGNAVRRRMGSGYSLRGGRVSICLIFHWSFMWLLWSRGFSFLFLLQKLMMVRALAQHLRATRGALLFLTRDSTPMRDFLSTFGAYAVSARPETSSLLLFHKGLPWY
jgi:hypothetical protein